MLLSTAFVPYLIHYSIDEALTIIAESGFDAVDYSMTNKQEYCGKESETEAFQNKLKDIRSRIEANGLVVNQSHAPYPSAYGESYKNEEAFNEIVRSMRNAATLGAPIIVVHPIIYYPEGHEGDEEALFDRNIEFYSRLKPYCEEFNIKVGIENDWKWLRTLNGRVTVKAANSTPETFCRYIDTMDSPYFVGCLDLGHALVVKHQAEEFIRKLGGKRLQALHVHDVTPYYDSHLIPYYGGMVNWEESIKALREVGYQGDFTYEAGNFIKPVPKEMVPYASYYSGKMAEYLRGRIING